MIKIFKWFTASLLIIVIIVLALYFTLRVTNKIEIYKVKTGSMEAKIHVGDYILILKKSDYNIGDVVTYTSNSGFITHRIIKIDGNKITTKGDANNTEDDTIDRRIIIGKVIISGGILNIIINYKFALVGIMLSLYLFSWYFETRKEEKENISDNNSTDDIIEIDKENDAIIIKDEVKEENKKEEIIQNNDSTDVSSEESLVVKEEEKEETTKAEIKDEKIEEQNEDQEIELKKRKNTSVKSLVVDEEKKEEEPIVETKNEEIKEQNENQEIELKKKKNTSTNIQKNGEQIKIVKKQLNKKITNETIGKSANKNLDKEIVQSKKKGTK